MNEQIHVFISYAREDQERVEMLYQRLSERGYTPWLDREHIVPGQKWKTTIEKALKKSDFVVVCLSTTSINKRGFLQNEIRQALEQAKEMLEDDIYLIPVRLDDCQVPTILESIQWVNWFEENGWEDLLRALKFGLNRRGKKPPPDGKSSSREKRKADAKSSSGSKQRAQESDVYKSFHLAIKKKFPNISPTEVATLADYLIEELSKRISSDEQIAFLRPAPGGPELTILGLEVVKKKQQRKL